MGRPTIFPTGTTIYYPDKCENGYTLFCAEDHGVVLINMNGKIVRTWKEFGGFPAKMIPGGYVFGSLEIRAPQDGYQDQADVTMLDWEGNVLWTFDHNEEVEDPDKPKRWMARQHHEYQIEGNPVGYWVPGMDSSPDFQKMLILVHKDRPDLPEISLHNLLDDRLIEIDREGNILWEWSLLDHFDQFNLSEEIKNVMFRNPNMQPCGPKGQGDIFHVNCASYLGPNKWYDAGDERFHPDNIIMDDNMELAPGVFAAGDVRAKYLRQIATAVGDGAAAATAAERYISELESE